jgi:hypothetical protein
LVKIKNTLNSQNIDFSYLNSVEEEEAKHIINLIELINRYFKFKKMTIEVKDLISRVVILKSDKEKEAVSRQSNSSSNDWYAMYNKATESIFIDIGKSRVSRNKAADQDLYAIIHEIGHALHMKYMAPAAKKYFDDMSSYYRDFISEINETIERIENKIIFKKSFAKKKKKNILLKFEEFLDSQEKEVKDLIIQKYKKSKQDKSAYTDFLNSISSNNKQKEKSVDSIKEALSELHAIVNSIKSFFSTTYALKNEREDFAETFAQWLLDEKSLSKLNSIRINVSFSMSKSEGVPIIENRFYVLRQYIRLLLN